MSDTVPVQAVPAGSPVSEVAKPLTAIQTVEQELMNFIRQREQAVANVHAVEGAIQAAQHLLGKLKAAEAEAIAATKAAVEKALADAQKAQAAISGAEDAVEAEGSKIVEFAKKEL